MVGIEPIPGARGPRRDAGRWVVDSCRIHGELNVAAGCRLDDNNRETSRCRVQRGWDAFPSPIIYTTSARIQTTAEPASSPGVRGLGNRGSIKMRIAHPPVPLSRFYYTPITRATSQPNFHPAIGSTFDLAAGLAAFIDVRVTREQRGWQPRARGWTARRARSGAL